MTSLHLNEKLKSIVYHNNPIYEITNSDSIYKITNIGIIKQKLKEKLKALNQFRYLYLKFKKRFRDLLWVKIREPKIRKKYSHDYLVEHLHEDTDLNELLENWCRE